MGKKRKTTKKKKIQERTTTMRQHCKTAASLGSRKQNARVICAKREEENK